MAKKSGATSVRSIRLSDEDWAWLAEEAGRRSLNINSLVASFVAVARKPPLVRAAPAFVFPDTAKIVADNLRPQLQLGPTPTKPGSRLKDAKK